MRGFCEASIIILVLVNYLANCEGDVFYTSPVLAPPSNSRLKVTDRAKDFPILKLLTKGGQVKEVELSSDNLISQPVYVQKLEDQNIIKRTNNINAKRNPRSLIN